MATTQDLPQEYLKTVSANFKTRFADIIDRVVNNSSVLKGMIATHYGFVGDDLIHNIQLGWLGGFTSGELGLLPTAVPAAKTAINVRSLYQRGVLDSKSMQLASNKNDGAFLGAMKSMTMEAVKNFNRHVQRQILGTAVNNGLVANGGDITRVGGHVGVAKSVTVDATNADEFSIVLEATDNTDPGDGKPAKTFKPANLEENDTIWFKEVGTISNGQPSDIYRVINIPQDYRTSKTVKVKRVKGSKSLTTAADITGGTLEGLALYIEGNDEMNGLEGMIFGSAGKGGHHKLEKVHNVAVQRRWSSLVKDVNERAFSTSMLDEIFEEQLERLGSTFKTILVGHIQWKQFKKYIEGKAQYTVRPVDPKANKMGWKVLSYESSMGAVPIVVERFVRDDVLMLLDTDKIKIYGTKKPGFITTDGSMLMRVPDRDWYEFRFGGFQELMCHITYQGAIVNLAVE